MNDVSLNTLFCQVEEILNNRPLMPQSDDPNDLQHLTSNHLLRLETSIPSSPSDLKNLKFMVMLDKRILPTLQLTKSRAYQIDDFVLVID